jgi:hypothetical protein
LSIRTEVHPRENWIKQTTKTKNNTTQNTKHKTQNTKHKADSSKNYDLRKHLRGLTHQQNDRTRFVTAKKEYSKDASKKQPNQHK